MERSLLLERVFKKVEEKGHVNSMTVRFFLGALLEIMLDDALQDILPEEVKSELGRARAIFVENSLDVVALRDRMLETDEVERGERMLFAKIKFFLEKRVVQQEIEKIDTCMYLNEIFGDYKGDVMPLLSGVQASSSATKTTTGRSASTTKKRTTTKKSTTSSADETEHTEATSGSTTSAVGNGSAFSDIVNRSQHMQRVLLDTVFGQDDAISSFVSGYFQAELTAATKKDPTKPKSVFLFAGPPGVGKTFLSEQAAQLIGLPFKRFDMSEYSDKEANLEFAGSDKVYKNGKRGNVTEFVEKNPRCVLLFDEIEKANLKVIYLFLQILDAGRLRDNYTDEEVSFQDATIIFTTNVGKSLYEDGENTNLSALPQKTILKALAAERDPATKEALFPPAICSRFAAGNVVMFNHLGAGHLYSIAAREIQKKAEAFEAFSGIEVNIDHRIPSAIMFAEGGKADARTVKARASAFYHSEMFELFRLLASEKVSVDVSALRRINFKVSLDQVEPALTSLFESSEPMEILIFAEQEKAEAYIAKIPYELRCYHTDSVEEAKALMAEHEFTIVLCDLNCHVLEDTVKFLHIEDLKSVGKQFLEMALERYHFPMYLLAEKEGDISQEEFLSFARSGVKGVLTLHGKEDFGTLVQKKCALAYQQNSMFNLARENKVVSYHTAQTISRDQRVAEIELTDFKRTRSLDAEDAKNILSDISKPEQRFADVIGAEDAKTELSYFVEFLKAPKKYMQKGVRAPKGVLLYGPPGTGKTMLARAMAGESDVTFLNAEGNQFVKGGADAVHEIFRSARKYAPSILFVDEIDAIGKSRAQGLSEWGSEILTAFLTEMDGFTTDKSRPVFVLAATNYGVDERKERSLDSALLRRFDRRIYVDLPNKDERRRYLEMKVEQHPAIALSAEQIDNIAVRSTGMSLAELESVFELALRSALRSNDYMVGDAAFEEAFETFQNGEKKDWDVNTLVRTARHEAGHALLCWLGGETPSYLTIVARGDHGGYMQHGDHEKKNIYTRADLLHRIRTSLAGRAAELVYYGAEDGISTGASGDLNQATKLAEQMLCSYGMDEELGLSVVDERLAGDAYIGEIRTKVNQILSEQLQFAVSAIEEHSAVLDRMVDELMVKNHLKESEINAIFSGTI